MSTLIQAIRFVIGLAMLVAGVVAAGPYVASLVAAHGGAAAVWPRQEPAGPPQPAAAPPDRVSVAATPVSAGPWPGEMPPAAATVAAPLVPPGDWRPPTPPDALPRTAPELARAAPPLDAAYRSTVDVPPPPLLDADSPPPLAVAWTANRTAPGGAQPSGPAATSTYVVRDGDDLTGIAMKVYGHAGGAQAIWTVNRDRLSDPNLLPIGLELRIPPSWSVPAVQPGVSGGRVIEPGRRPARVRVAPGETFETLAERFYGDRSVAPRLYEANRDLLRDPALLVPGMELRLP